MEGEHWGRMKPNELFKRKEGIEILTNFFVIFFIVILILSFLIAKVLINVWVVYIIVVFVAIVLGNLLYMSRYQNKFPYYCLAFAFLVGTLLGHRVGNVFLITVLFAGIMFASYKISKAISES